MNSLFKITGEDLTDEIDGTLRLVLAYEAQKLSTSKRERLRLALNHPSADAQDLYDSAMESVIYAYQQAAAIIIETLAEEPGNGQA